MKIGIDASRAFLKQRTGIEEYSYQVIKHLRKELQNEEVFLYVKNNQEIDFDLPKKWKVKKIYFPRFWTQLGLSLELLLHPIHILFIPAHVVPMIHPKNTVVTIHGLEFERAPEAYSWWERLYMRVSIRLSCRWAKSIISVSKNTKNDLVSLYKIPEGKIFIVPEGVEDKQQTEEEIRNKHYKIPNSKYLLFIGRLEKRKNIEGIIEAFEILKEKYEIPHKLMLVGKFGFGKEGINRKIEKSPYRKDIILTGFVGEDEKQEILNSADIFLFPTFYEGFGLPVLEAQRLGIPAVVSNTSSIPEVAGEGAAYCNPDEPLSIADSIYSVIKDESFRGDIINKGYENARRFSWEKCAAQITDVIRIG